MRRGVPLQVGGHGGKALGRFRPGRMLVRLEQRALPARLRLVLRPAVRAVGKVAVRVVRLVGRILDQVRLTLERAAALTAAEIDVGNLRRPVLGHAGILPPKSHAKKGGKPTPNVRSKL